MGRFEGQEPGDDLSVEVTSLREDEHDGATGKGWSPFTSRRSRLATLLGGVSVVAVVAVLLVSVPGLREGAVRLVGGRAGSAPTAPATVVRTPYDDLIYLLPNPPGVEVSVDGNVVRALPLPGGGHPLRLAPGTHSLRWTSQTLPFRPLACQISVPRATKDTCPFVNPNTISAALRAEPGSIIGMHETIDTLAQGDRDALEMSIRNAVAAERSATTVNQGEYYGLSGSTYPNMLIIGATAPLTAALTFTYVGGSGYPEPCILAQPSIPCRFPGQNCNQICSVAQAPSGLGQSSDWIGAVVVNANWEYQDEQGRQVATGVSEAFGTQLMAVRITYTGGKWTASAIVGNIPGFEVASDPVCDPVRYLLGTNNVWGFAVDDPPPEAHMAFVTAANLADGCAAVFLGHNAAGEEPAIFLQRFGVVRTVNATADNSVAGLPRADAYEQALARRILGALLG